LGEAEKDVGRSRRTSELAGDIHLVREGVHPNEVQIDRRDAKLAIALTASILAFRAS